MNSDEATVIFDLFGVLFRLHIPRILRHVGLWNIFRHMVIYRKSPFTSCFEMLEKIRQEIPGEYQERMAYQNHFLPKTLCKWQQGLITNKQALARMYELIDLLDREHYFATSQDKKMAIICAQVMFDAQRLADAVIPNKRIVKLANQLRAQDHRIYILSNIDHDVYTKLRADYPAVFAPFNGIVTSYQTKLLKPEPAIFLYLCEQYNCDPEHCVFIDDQLENIDTARSLGMKVILYRRGINLYRRLKKYFLWM